MELKVHVAKISIKSIRKIPEDVEVLTLKHYYNEDYSYHPDPEKEKIMNEGFEGNKEKLWVRTPIDYSFLNKYKNLKAICVRSVDESGGLLRAMHEKKVILPEDLRLFFSIELEVKEKYLEVLKNFKNLKVLYITHYHDYENFLKYIPDSLEMLICYRWHNDEEKLFNELQDRNILPHLKTIFLEKREKELKKIENRPEIELIKGDFYWDKIWNVMEDPKWYI